VTRRVRVPASRLLLPRSGLERSDFVPWPRATCRTIAGKTAFRPTAVVAHADFCGALSGCACS
jgi:hypothetical protein